MKRIVLICCLIATPAAANEVTLNGKLDGTENVIVWKDFQSLREGMNLWRSGVARRNPSLAYPLVSCIVPVGTSAIVTDSTIGTKSILVTSGEFSGCRGSVNIESINGL